MRQRNAALAGLFIVLESIVIYTISNVIKHEIWYFKIALNLLYTIFVFEMSCLLINIFYTQVINSLKREINTIFLFDNEKMSIKLTMLISSLIILLYSIHFDIIFIVFGTIIISGHFISNQVVININDKKIMYISNYFMEVKEITSIRIEEDEIKIVLDNKKRIVFKSKEKKELDRLKYTIDIAIKF